MRESVAHEQYAFVRCQACVALFKSSKCRVLNSLSLKYGYSHLGIFEVLMMFVGSMLCSYLTLPPIGNCVTYLKWFVNWDDGVNAMCRVCHSLLL